MTSTSSPVTLRLEDGAQMAYAFYGEIESPKHDVLFFHGLQSCHLEAKALEAAAQALRVRLIAMDRPGTGESTPSPDRSISSWPHMVEYLVDRLQLASFSILAVSGGGPYALACAHHFPSSRLKSIGLVASVGPAWELGTAGLRSTLRVSTFLAQWMPLSILGNLLDKQYGAAVADPNPEVLEGKVRSSLVGLDPASAAVIDEKEGIDDMAAKLRAAYAHGSLEVAREMKLVASDWGFKLEEVDFTGRLHLHIGTEDCNMPIAMAQRMAGRLKGATLHEYPGATHFTLVPEYGRAILELLVDE
jgi:pimeloyl-ACP methyl ester carboxylesterase